MYKYPPIFKYSSSWLIRRVLASNWVAGRRIAIVDEFVLQTEILLGKFRISRCENVRLYGVTVTARCAYFYY